MILRRILNYTVPGEVFVNAGNCNLGDGDASKADQLPAWTHSI